MNLEHLMETVPAYAKDLKLNLSSVMQQPDLTPQQAWGSALACAMAARNPRLLTAIAAEAAKHLSPEAVEAAKAAAAIMGMNNVFYRFHHLTTNQKYSTMPARLRMNVLRTHGIAHVDFELFCLAVSAINACDKCVDSHEKVVREKGLAEENVLAAVRIASVLHALASVLDAEAVLVSA
ncbi:MAG: carboxymuconolactone decarboxylase family protein [Acidobacteria bacterium]|nr:carboxymuconolactone decarboxylase family protein [Bryobacteraceae bacterium CoA2 C42]